MSARDLRATPRVEGHNHTIEWAGDVIEARVWKRPDLDMAAGAANAAQIERTLVEWLERSPKGLVFDVSDGPETAGPKTQESIGGLLRTFADRGVRVAVVVGPSALQRMQYSRMVTENARAHGRVCHNATEAAAFLRERRRGGTI